jgi:hypothetical protein
VGKVTAAVHTESYRGPVEKEITVTSDDPTHPLMSLHIKLNIVGSIDILPRAYMSMPVPPNMDYTARIVVRKEKSEKGELNITEANATAPWIAVKTRKVDKPEPPTAELPAAQPGDYIVEATVTDESQIVQSGQQIRFKTGLTREPQTAIPLSIAVQQAVSAVPATLVLVTNGAKEVSGTINVAVRQSLAKQPVTTAVTPQAFSVKLDPDGDRRYKATVTWKSDGNESSKLGWVTFNVTGESVRVPVRVRDTPVPLKPMVPPGTGPEGTILTAPDTPPAGQNPGAASPPAGNPPNPTPPSGGSPSAPPPPQKP